MREASPLHIIVPTDFSLSAHRALEFAVMLAYRTHVKLDILHIYTIPFILTRGSHFADIEKGKENLVMAEAQMQQLVTNMKGLDEVEYETAIRPMYGAIEIPEIIRAEKGDLVIMGSHGTNNLMKWIMGSNTASVIQDTLRPVLVIPEDGDCHHVERIGFAYDGAPVADPTKLDFLLQLAGILDARIDVFHVRPDATQEISREQSADTAALIQYLGEYAGSYYDIVDQPVKEGINTAVEAYNFDLLAMVQRNKSLPERLFIGHMTKRMLDHVKTGLLVIAE